MDVEGGRMGVDDDGYDSEGDEGDNSDDEEAEDNGGNFQDQDDDEHDEGDEEDLGGKRRGGDSGVRPGTPSGCRWPPSVRSCPSSRPRG